MSSSQRLGRRLQFENLECRALMTSLPIAANCADQVSAVRTDTAIVSSAVAITEAEEEGLNAAELAKFSQLASRGVAAYANAADAPPAYVDKNGNLIIHGCKGSEFVNVTGGKNGVVWLSHAVDGKRPSPWNEYGNQFSGVKKIIFLGYGGQNDFRNQTTLPSEALGGSGVDKFLGGQAVDTFFGLGGNDELKGGYGNDMLFGGTGCDYLEAGPTDNGEQAAKNVLKGGGNNDYLMGGSGWDEMYGNSGSDILRDNAGHGRLYGGIGNDRLYGYDYAGPNSQRLELHGEADSDILVVKKHVFEFYKWSRDDYTDDQIFAANPPAVKISSTQFEDLFHIKNWKKDA